MIYVYVKEDGYISQKINGRIEEYAPFIEQDKYFGCIESDLDICNKDILSYKVENGDIVKRDNQELDDIKKYGFPLSNEAREKIKNEEKEREFQSRVKPTRDEILKAEVKLEMIEMLGLEKGV